MLITLNPFGLGLDGYFDTAIPTSQLDEMTMYEGLYDEVFMTLDTTVTPDNIKPGQWDIKHIMHAKFQEDLEAGTLDADGHTITDLQVYRKEVRDGAEWMLLAEFEYVFEYNIYSVLDRTAENGTTYEYAIVPLAEDVIGEIKKSNQVKAEYEGSFISDLNHNYEMEFDVQIGEIRYNKQSAVASTLAGKFPTVMFNKDNYRTGTIRFLPLTHEQKRTGGTKIDNRAETLLRKDITDFLNNGQAKILRTSNGEVQVVATHNVRSISKEGALQDIHDIEFDYVEVGDLSESTLARTGLIADAVKSHYTYDDQGNVVWGI